MTCFRCGGILNDGFIANVPKIVSVKNFENQSIFGELSVLFLTHSIVHKQNKYKNFKTNNALCSSYYRHAMCCACAHKNLLSYTMLMLILILLVYLFPVTDELDTVVNGV